ncbi:MAG: hypothetical protein F6K28_50425, partial [Microcoleus sp. SIO2G3]|nr:hypothetical protein [Microcoleus sp. SIO2G3]
SKECETEGATAPCSATSPRQARQAGIVPPSIEQAIASLPLPNWGSQPDDRLPEAMERMYGDLLQQAQRSASQSKFADALSTVSGIPNNSQHHDRAKQLQETWSQELLQRANSRAQQGDVNSALSMLDAIPPTSDRHERALALRDRWDDQADLLAQARSAKDSGDWQGVIEAIESLEGTPVHDSLPVQQLLQQAIYRSYQSDASLMQTADIDRASAEAAIATLSAEQATLPDGAVPNVANLPIDVSQALAWAQPVTPPVAATPQPTRPFATNPAAPAAPAAIAPPASVANLTIDKASGNSFSRQITTEDHNSERMTHL